MVFSWDLSSWVLYFTSCSLVALVTLFSWVIFSYSDAASASSCSVLARPVAKADSQTFLEDPLGRERHHGLELRLVEQEKVV